MNRCVGPPTCPAGYVGEGDNCVADASVPSAPAPVEASASAATAQPAPYAVPAAESPAQTTPIESRGEGASDNAEPTRTHFYARASLGIGYGHYLHSTGRNAGGFMVSASGALGARFPSGLIVGASFSADPIFGMSGSSSRGTPVSAPIAFGGTAGPLVGYAGGPWIVEASLLFGGGGAFGVAGGLGALLAPYVGYSIARRERFGLQLYLRPLLGILVDLGVGVPVVDLAFTAGVSVAWD